MCGPVVRRLQVFEEAAKEGGLEYVGQEPFKPQWGIEQVRAHMSQPASLSAQGDLGYVLPVHSPPDETCPAAQQAEPWPQVILLVLTVS